MSAVDRAWTSLAPPALRPARGRLRWAATAFAASMVVVGLVALSVLASLVQGCNHMPGVNPADITDKGCKVIEAAHNACTVLHFTTPAGERVEVRLDEEVLTDLHRTAVRQGRAGSAPAPSGSAR